MTIILISTHLKNIPSPPCPALQCNHYGSLEWEKFWSKRCKVTLFHYTAKFKGNVCEYPAKDSGGETSMKGVASVRDCQGTNICSCLDYYYSILLFTSSGTLGSPDLSLSYSMTPY